MTHMTLLIFCGRWRTNVEGGECGRWPMWKVPMWKVANVEDGQNIFVEDAQCGRWPSNRAVTPPSLSACQAI